MESGNPDESIHTTTPEPKPLEKNIKEIRRRREVFEALQKDDNPCVPYDMTTSELPYVGSQRFVLFTTSHVRMPPIASDPDRPGIRFYGLFPDQESAAEHAENLKMLGVNIQLHPVNSWCLMASCEEHLLDAEYSNNKIASLLHLQRQRHELAHKDVRENVSNARMGDGVEKAPEQASESVRFAHKATLRDKKKTTGMSVFVQPFTGQRYIAVSFVSDPTCPDTPEPLFRVYGAFDSIQDAEKWIKARLVHYVFESDIDILSTCQWIFPLSAYKELPCEVYRNSELHAIMDYRRNAPEIVQNFKDWMQVNDARSDSSKSSVVLEGVATHADVA